MADPTPSASSAAPLTAAAPLGTASPAVPASASSAGVPGSPSVPLPAGARPGVVQLVFRDKNALYAAYIPLFTDGGLFVPTTRDYRLGDDIYLLVSLPDDPQRFPVAGKVGWVTPGNASGGRSQGVGVRFPADEKTRLLRNKIEELLGTSVQSAKPTQTI